MNYNVIFYRTVGQHASMRIDAGSEAQAIMVAKTLRERQELDWETDEGSYSAPEIIAEEADEDHVVRRLP